MKYYQIEPEKIGRMVASLRRHSSIGFDVETTDLDPYHGELRLMQFSPDPEKAFVVDLRDFPSPRRNTFLDPVRALLSDYEVEKIGHNLKFDAKFVKHHLGCDLNSVFDTFLASKIEGCGVPHLRHRLSDVAERFLGIEVDKTEQRSDWSANELSPRQLAYAAKDVCILHELQSAILKKLIAKRLISVAKLENDIVMAMAQTELNGFFLNQSMWRQQLRIVTGLTKTAARELQSVLAAGNRQGGFFGALEIDLGSQQQVANALLGVGVPVPLTDAGNYTTKESEIENLKYDFPAVDKLLEWRGLSKQLTSYGENILGFVNPATGRIHADFAQLRAPSGRMGCENPNLQNMPAEIVYRSCFQAPEGRKLVIADFSQIELRVMAELSQDKAMVAAFKSGVDYHTATAMSVFNVPTEAVTPEQRNFAKRVNFGIGYGIGAPRLSRMTGMPLDKTEKFLEQYFSALAGLDKWLKRQAYVSVKSGRAETLSGRAVRFIYDRDDHRDRKSVERKGKNVPVQGTAADIFKRSLHLLHEDLKGTSGAIVNLVHDEIVCEADAADADVVARKMERCMIQAGGEYLKLVPVKVDAKIADVWSK